MNAAIYARVSTKIGSQNPDMQLRELHEYCKQRGWDVAGEYVDAGVSGSRDRRPALDRLLDDARRRNFGAVVVVKLDRLARSVLHLTAMGAEFEALGVDLVVVDQAIDTSTPSGRLLFNVLGAIAEFERDLIRERTAAGVAAARRRGRHPGRPRALSKRNRERALRLRRSGKSLRAIARLLGVGHSTVARELTESGSPSA